MGHHKLQRFAENLTFPNLFQVGFEQLEKEGTLCRKKCTDDNGNRFRTKREAVAAREAAIVALRIEKTTRPKPVRRLVKEVFTEYCAEGRKDRAYQTIRKQDIMALQKGTTFWKYNF